MLKAKHFKIHELVCSDVYNRDGESAWRYFRPVLIRFIDWVREELDKPVYINNWYWGGYKSQRGLRCNLCPIVKGKTSKNTLYVSGHILGAAIDFNVKGMTPDEVRDWLKYNIHRFFEQWHRYPKKIRVESWAFAPTWVHVDFYDHDEPRIIDIIELIP